MVRRRPASAPDGLPPEHLELPEHLQPPEHLQTYVGPGDFGAIGASFLALFRELGQLAPDEDVLDIGSGSGRMAVPLTRYLEPTARYEGFDISTDAVRWCQEHISPEYPNFGFRSVDVANTHYNPDGTVAADQFSFPYPDASFDFVFATSVFTHMLPAGLDRYTSEAARVLRPGGRLFVTVYLWDDDVAARMEQGVTSVAFPVDHGHFRAACDDLEAVVAYDADRLLDQLQGPGLRLQGEVHTGWWTGRDPDECATYQDVVVLVKP